MADNNTSSMRKVKQLQEIFPDANMTQSVYATVLKTNDNDMDKAIDELLTITADFGINTQSSNNSSSNSSPPTEAQKQEQQAQLEALAIMQQQQEDERKRLEMEAIIKKEEERKRIEKEAIARQKEEERRRLQQQKTEAINRQKEEEEKQRLAKQDTLLTKEQALLQKEEELKRQQKEFEENKKKEVEELENTKKRIKHQEELKKRELERIKKKEEITKARIKETLAREYEERVQQAVLSKESQLHRTIEQTMREQIEQEVKQNLEDEIREQIAKEFESKKQEAEIPTPVVAIYVNDKSPQTTEEVQEIRAFLAAVDVADCDIVSCNLENSTDNELRAFLVEKTGGKLSYPIVCIHSTPVGKIAELKKLKAESKLIPLLNGDATVLDAPAPELKAGTNQIIGRGALDTCLDAAEYVGSGVSTLLWLPITAITYPFRSAAPTLTKGENDVDFEVTHTNWYYRNLVRLFRFTDDNILRIHPRHMDIRGSHAYSTVESITFSSPSKIVITYNDGSIPDYITAMAEDCANIAELIIARASHKVTIKNQDECQDENNSA